MRIFIDKHLSQLLEITDGKTNIDIVSSHAKLFPKSGVEWNEIAGTFASFDGLESPLTQTFGLGLFETIGEKELDQIEAFFHRHKAPIFHEVSPMVDPSLMMLLHQRGYQPIELTSI